MSRPNPSASVSYRYPISVPCGLASVIARCSFGQPRIVAPPAIGSDVQTPALARLTVGSQSVGGMPVSAANALVSSATPASAVVLVPVVMVSDQSPVAAVVDSGPVASHQRWSPRYRRCVDVLTWAQSGYCSTASLSM